jgi:hypothetical protein
MEFYEEGSVVGSIEYNKVIILNSEIENISKTLLNRLEIQGVELVALEDSSRNIVEYASVRRLKREFGESNQMWIGDIAWKIGSGIGTNNR